MCLNRSSVNHIWIPTGNRTYAFAHRINPDAIEPFGQITIADADRYLVTIESETVTVPTIRNAIGFIE